MNKSKPHGETPLHVVAKRGRADMIAELLARGADVNAADTSGLAPLSYAAEGWTEAAVQLLTHGANIHVRTKNDKSLLLTACERRLTGVSEALLDRGADLNDGVTGVGWTPLHAATQGNFEDIVKLLLTRGVTVDIRCSDGKTPLMVTAKNDFKYIAEDLLKHDADVHQTDYNDSTSLHLAAARGEERAVALLLASGVRTNVLDKENHTPLDCARAHDHEAVTEL